MTPLPSRSRRRWATAPRRGECRRRAGPGGCKGSWDGWCVCCSFDLFHLPSLQKKMLQTASIEQKNQQDFPSIEYWWAKLNSSSLDCFKTHCALTKNGLSLVKVSNLERLLPPGSARWPVGLQSSKGWPKSQKMSVSFWTLQSNRPTLPISN